jgi:Trp operon repressor
MLGASAALCSVGVGALAVAFQNMRMKEAHKPDGSVLSVQDKRSIDNKDWQPVYEQAPSIGVDELVSDTEIDNRARELVRIQNEQRHNDAVRRVKPKYDQPHVISKQEQKTRDLNRLEILVDERKKIRDQMNVMSKQVTNEGNEREFTEKYNRLSKDYVAVSNEISALDQSMRKAAAKVASK